MIEIDVNCTILVALTDSLVFYVVEYTDFELGRFISFSLDTIILFRLSRQFILAQCFKNHSVVAFVLKYKI